MAEPDCLEPRIYQLRAVLRGISPLIWRRLLVRSDTPRGAHLLLQIRVQALNDDLPASFERWYPDLRRRHEETLAA
jgi:hypothetical protein